VTRVAAVTARDVRSSLAGGILDGISQVPTNLPHGEAWREEGEAGSPNTQLRGSRPFQPPVGARGVWLTWERGTAGSRCPRSSAMIVVEPSRGEGRWGSRGWRWGGGSRGVRAGVVMGGPGRVQAGNDGGPGGVLGDPGCPDWGWEGPGGSTQELGEVLRGSQGSRPELRRVPGSPGGPYWGWEGPGGFQGRPGRG